MKLSEALSIYGTVREFQSKDFSDPELHWL
jgi:hypothetical protein